MSALVAWLAICASPAFALFTPTGDFSPADPSSWTASTTSYIGQTSAGTVTVDGGSSLLSYVNYLGYNPGSTGTLAINGASSKLTNGTILPLDHIPTLVVGESGDGTLALSNGGSVSTSKASVVADNAGSHGMVTIDGANSTWNAYYGVTIGGAGSGALQVTHGGTMGLMWGLIGASAGGSGVVTVDGAGSTFGCLGGSTMFEVGASGAGTMNITHGGKVTCSNQTYVGEGSGSVGNVTVDGTDSTLTSNGPFDVGFFGAGTLTISHGGKVIAKSDTGVASQTGATGSVTVDGMGSTLSNTWFVVGDYGNATVNITHGGTITCSTQAYFANNAGTIVAASIDGLGSNLTTSGALTLGAFGKATLNLTNGGKVAATSASINTLSLLSIAVGDHSSLDLGTGALTNKGAIRLSAIANLAPGAYSPITAGAWFGTGSVQTLGGQWDASNHQFIVAAPNSGVAGSDVTIDRTTTQRICISDPGTGSAVAASFLPGDSSLTFTANPLNAPQTSSLENLLAAHTSILAGWTFTAPTYTPGDPVFLSLQVGPGYSPDTLSLWHLDTTTSAWTSYTPTDLSYDGTYANFTVTGFSGYAVSGLATLPEPTTLTLLALGLTPLLTRRRKSQP